MVGSKLSRQEILSYKIDRLDFIVKLLNIIQIMQSVSAAG